MKKLLLALAFAVLLSPFAPQAKSQNVSVDFFYNNLNGGSWIEVGNYGYCWQPDLAVNPSWRPYADGYWAYTDDGWTWVSYEDFGWATYHYGRWIRLTDIGWVWRPGYEWGPAWVSWRFGGGYAGWAPLPPETELVYESRPLSGHIDAEFDIGPANYNFVDVRYIGEPVLRSRIVPYQQNVTYVSQTVNVTNITYKNKTVYNYGPDLDIVNQYSSRPIQKLKLERQTNVDLAVGAKSGGLTKVQGNSLIVVAPARINRQAKEIAPPIVKTKIEQPKVQKGWDDVGDENAKNQLKEKIKTQDLTKIPPPAAGGNGAATTGASATPGATVTSATLTPTVPEKGKDRGKLPEQGATAQPARSPTAAAAATVAPESGKRGKRKQFEQPPAGITPSSASDTSRGSQGAPYSESQGKHKAEGANTPSTTTGGQMPAGTEQTGEKKRGGKEKAAAATATPGPQ
jgi:hypothetical protein